MAEIEKTKTTQYTSFKTDMIKVHCWKKKRDFRIIRSKVGGLVTRSVGVYKFFVWKCKILTMEFSKYQQYQQ